MKNIQTDNIEAIVSNHIDNILQLKDGQLLAPDSDLFGYFDSINIMELIMSLENEFGITLKPEDMISGKFNSVKNISNFIKGEISGH